MPAFGGLTRPQAHCWLRTGAESKHRSALALRNNVPPMCLFYPHSREENLFCWAMTKTWGQQYWGTNWELGFRAEMRMLSAPYAFESRYRHLYERPCTIAEVAVLYSPRTVWLHDDGEADPDYVRMSSPASTDC